LNAIFCMPNRAHFALFGSLRANCVLLAPVGVSLRWVYLLNLLSSRSTGVYVAVVVAGSVVYLRFVRGWRLGDLMYVTRASLNRSLTQVTSGDGQIDPRCVWPAPGVRSTSGFQVPRTRTPGPTVIQATARLGGCQRTERVVWTGGRDALRTQLVLYGTQNRTLGPCLVTMHQRSFAR
jgi:hypothetical protein